MKKPMARSKQLTPKPVTLPRRALTSAEFSQLAAVPPETEWFANIDNPHTRRAYRNDLKEFMTFTGIRTPIELRLITRAHVIAWRKDLDRRQLAAGSIRRKLSALSSLYEFLTDQNAVATNPVKGVKRPKVDSYEGKTPAIADKEARQLMNLPNDKTLKGLRDRALLATLLYHGLRREELCRLKIKDIHPRRGVPHLRVHGKGNKTPYIPLHAGTLELLNDYLDEAATPPTPKAPYSDPSATILPASSTTPSPPTASTNSCADMPSPSASRSARMHCAPQPPPMPSTTTPTSPRSRNGWDMPISQQPASTTGAR
jgi:site-specific recombinase XerD